MIAGAKPGLEKYCFLWKISLYSINSGANSVGVAIRNRIVVVAIRRWLYATPCFTILSFFLFSRVGEHEMAVFFFSKRKTEHEHVGLCTSTLNQSISKYLLTWFCFQFNRFSAKFDSKFVLKNWSCASGPSCWVYYHYYYHYFCKLPSCLSTGAQWRRSILELVSSSQLLQECYTDVVDKVPGDLKLP